MENRTINLGVVAEALKDFKKDMVFVVGPFEVFKVKREEIFRFYQQLLLGYKV